MRQTRLAIALFLLIGPVGANAEDSVRIVSISPPAGTALARGTPLRFRFVVHYELTSRRSAILSLSLEQLRSRASGCKSDPSDRHSGELVTAVNIPVRKGSRDIETSITWPGDTGKGTSGRIYGSGYVTFVPMYWENRDGARGDRFRILEETADYCYTFGQ
jgi:hypothetical protein